MPLSPLAAAFQPAPQPPPPPPQEDPLKAILKLVDEDFHAVNRLIAAQLKSPVALVE